MDDSILISQISVMHQQENSKSYSYFDYMSMPTSILRPPDREALCNWGYQTIAACKGVSRSTAAKAISFFDRFLGTSAPEAQEALSDLGDSQLAFVACLVIALKVHSGFNVEIDFVSNVVCGKMYDANEIIAMELHVLQALGWKLNGPTPHDFIDYYLKLVPSIEEIHRDFLIRFSKGLAELALMKYTLALQRPSEVAFASVFCALQYTDCDATESLSIIQMVSGLDHHDRRLGGLLRCMISFAQELFSNRNGISSY
jgi:hypothetical protein